jgi:hypothetical protein
MPASPDPRAVFRHAVCFEHSAELLANATRAWFDSWNGRPAEGYAVAVELFPGTHHRIPTLIPQVVNKAFATELFLKSLLTLDGLAFPRSHSLLTLFGQLQAARQRHIEELYDQDRQSDQQMMTMERQRFDGLPFSLQWCLSEMDTAFEQWRYAYEDFSAPGPLYWQAVAGDPARDT